MARYEVHVGNIGMVYDGSSYKKALRAYLEYVSQSKAHYGRASQESVTLFSDGEIVREFIGELDKHEGEDNAN